MSDDKDTSEKLREMKALCCNLYGDALKIRGAFIEGWQAGYNAAGSPGKFNAIDDWDEFIARCMGLGINEEQP